MKTSEKNKSLLFGFGYTLWLISGKYSFMIVRARGYIPSEDACYEMALEQIKEEAEEIKNFSAYRRRKTFKLVAYTSGFYDENDKFHRPARMELATVKVNDMVLVERHPANIEVVGEPRGTLVVMQETRLV